MLNFDWDETKGTANRKKHGVSFDEAQTVFFDDDALEYSDPDHSEEESRFMLLGRSVRLRLLIVCHCFRQDDAVIRIISARKATPPERKAYGRRGKP